MIRIKNVCEKRFAQLTQLHEKLITAVCRTDLLPVSVLFFITFCYFQHYLLDAPEPPDDLLRHAVAYLYHLDYRQMFPWSEMPAFNNWYLFDLVVGLIHQHAEPLQPGLTVILVRTASYALYAVAFFLLTAEIENRNLRFLLFSLSLLPMASRLGLARPAEFESALCLLAVGLANRKGIPEVVHFLLGCLIASFYYMFFIYLIPLILYRRGYLLAVIVGLVGWTWYGGTEYFTVVYGLFTEAPRRAMPVIEAGSIMSILKFAPFLVPFLMYALTDLRKTLTIGWFLAANQIRYFETILPLSLSYIKKLPELPHWVLVIVFLLNIYNPIGSSGPSSKALRNFVPEQSKVLFLDFTAMFRAVYSNPTIRSAPSMNVALEHPAVSTALTAALKDHTFHEPVLELGFEYIVEDTINSSKMPNSVELLETFGKLRLWRVKKVQE